MALAATDDNLTIVDQDVFAAILRSSPEWFQQPRRAASAQPGGSKFGSRSSCEFGGSGLLPRYAGSWIDGLSANAMDAIVIAVLEDFTRQNDYAMRWQIDGDEIDELGSRDHARFIQSTRRHRSRYRSHRSEHRRHKRERVGASQRAPDARNAAAA